MPRYEITTENREVNTKRFYRIRALKDFRIKNCIEIKNGDLGGWIEKEENLHQNGNCWVGDNAIVKDDAIVKDNAIVKENARISISAIIEGDAIVEGNAFVSDFSRIGGHSRISNSASIYGRSEVLGYSHIGGKCILCGSARVRDKTLLYDQYINEPIIRIPIFISGLPWDITIMDTKMKIGCEIHTFEEWDNFSKNEILNMEGEESFYFWEEYKESLRTIIKNLRPGHLI